MGIIDRLKSMVGLEKEEAFRRWSATELADKKAYLESKSPGSFTAADHYLSAEWVIQRYLPEGDEPTDEQWSKKIKEIRQKIDINIKMAAAGTLHNNQSDSSDDDDPEFKLWLDEHLK
ncbi:hypothetical protein AAER22_10030 [Pseudomonas aeruginosa]|uniref:Uncharacterized protein n=5 Tax=Pseudomonas aeruginosa TaxID=287 RepID=A0A367MD42_PSEAI|nr:MULTISPECIES: hypothetical protein [Pseudomonas]MDG0900187.1 hypothetical protein [Pseudomonas sp. L01]HCL2909890.1 hypothetical protein [Pseudomonas aeruginosa 059A]ALY65065.1 hypothetical protein HW05_09210 [Pseudomonas aeruginosa]ALZ14777.1 hypothetical protein HV98_19825 [Pseudomonas aeruginosa]AYZ86211.1 hypothetical protein EGY27_26395 [Pseudomonas aeruginosa]